MPASVETDPSIVLPSKKADDHSGDSKDSKESTYKKVSPYDTPYWFFHLFFNVKFTVHRVLGLVYLISYVYAWYLYVYDYNTYRTSHVVWSLPINGLVQSLTATYYFSFLPRKVDPGYYSDKGALSYFFVAENIFFAAALAFAFLYNSEVFYPYFRSFPGTIAEHFFVFLPYFVRPLFPKTSFRDSLRNGAKNKTGANAAFFFVGTWMTKFFYVWAKWFIGFFLNYLRYADKFNEEQLHEMHRLLLFSAFATNISMFLHTLKFKGYIGPKTSFGTYIISYLCTFYSIICLGDLFFSSPILVGLAVVGMILNFGPVWAQHVWQIFAMGLLYGVRSGKFDISL